MPKPPPIEVIARGVWLASGQLLLCRNVARGYRFLPGGHVEFGEPAAEALAREMSEEAGLAVQVGPLLATIEASFHQPRPLAPSAPLKSGKDTPKDAKKNAQKNPKSGKSQASDDAAQAVRLHHELNLIFPMHAADAPHAPGSPDALPGVTSCEKKIAFDWVPLLDLVGPNPTCDLFPTGIAQALAPLLAPDGALEGSAPYSPALVSPSAPPSFSPEYPPSYPMGWASIFS